MKYLLLFLLGLLPACDKWNDPTVNGSLPGVTGVVYGHHVASHNLIVFVWGQSNNVRFEEYGEQTFVEDWQKEYPGSIVRFINCAVGGTGISQWQAGGPLVSQCNTGGLTPSVILFYQGEADAYNNTANWEQQFYSAVKGWRQQFNQPDLPIVFAQLAVEDPAIYCPAQQWDMIKQQQADINIHNVKMIKTDDISMLDPDPNVAQGVHLSQASYTNIAQRYVEAIIQIGAN